MPRTSIFDMPFPKVYDAMVKKAERKGRTTYGEFLAGAPSWTPRSEYITGKICGVQVETIEDSAMKKVRQLDKLVDELAKGRPMEKIKR